MKRKINFIEAAMKYRQIIIAITVAMMILGIFGLINMPRREFPEFTIRQGVIVGVFPGAASEEVEEQLTKVTENYIFGYEEVNKEKTYSVSSEGQMIVFLELNDNVKNPDKFWSKLRHGLDELKAQKLPAGVLALVGSNDFGDVSALLITMSSEEKSYRELEEIMKDLQDEIRHVSSVSKIKLHGTQSEEVYVYLDQDKLNEYSLNPTTIMLSFQLQELMDYAGELDNNELILPVHLPPKYNSEKDIEEQIVFSDATGNIIRLKDVARVERKYEDPKSLIKNNGNNSLLLSLEMQSGNNIVQFGDDIKEVIANFKSKTDDDVQINIISDLPNVVNHSISHFLTEFIIAILAVIAVTMILLPFRVSSVAAITIPITILITIGIMQLVGIQLHIVSLAGLIVVLGMVVDNAIVIIDNHVDKLDHGDKPWEAAWKAATELFIPVLGATAAITAAFFPLMFFLKGMAADFVGTFPVTIGIALGVSMIIAILLVPFLCFTFIKTGLHKKTEVKKNKISFLDKVQKNYDMALDWTFRNPKVTLSIAVISIILGIFLFSLSNLKMFPEMDRDQFAVEIYLPEGSSLDQTVQLMDSVEAILSKDERIINIASFAGSSSPRFNDLYAPHMPAKNFGQLMVTTVSNEATINLLNEYAPKYSNYFPSGYVRFKQIAIESFEAPIEIKVSGDDVEILKEKADEIAEILRSNDDITWVRNDWGEKRRGLKVDLDREKVNQMGYAKSMVATSLMTSLVGLPVATLWEGDYPMKVLLAKEDYQINNIDDLGNQNITSIMTMNSVPLRSIADIKPEWTEGNIVRENGIRTITVQADLKRNIVASSILKQIKPDIENIDLPNRYSIAYGGDAEATEENIPPLGKSLITSVLLIYFILMFEFKTSRRALLIMSTMLLSFPGAALGLWITGYPFGVTAFIGIIGLVGIVVRNGIILIDYAMELVNKKGYSFKDAAIASGKRRMRPIFLTSMAAAMGVVPMIISQSPLWGPLGTVICFGMIVGMVLTLFVLPVLYWLSSENEYAKKKVVVAE